MTESLVSSNSPSFSQVTSSSSWHPSPKLDLSLSYSAVFLAVFGSAIFCSRFAATVHSKCSSGSVVMTAFICCGFTHQLLCVCVFSVRKHYPWGPPTLWILQPCHLLQHSCKAWRTRESEDKTSLGPSGFSIARISPHVPWNWRSWPMSAIWDWDEVTNLIMT